MEGKLDGAKSLLDSGRAASAGKEMLKELARSDPYYKRNRPKICSFFVKGECNRGDECPFRHEMPQEDMKNQTIKSRYHGTTDPVARKILAGHAATHGMQPPEDETITSLFLTLLPPSTTEASLRTVVVQSLGQIDPENIRSIVHVAKSRCAFVNFKDRVSAERAAELWALGLDIDGTRAGVKWGRSKAAKAGSGPSASAATGSTATPVAA